MTSCLALRTILSASMALVMPPECHGLCKVSRAPHCFLSHISQLLALSILLPAIPSAIGHVTCIPLLPILITLILISLLEIDVTPPRKMSGTIRLRNVPQRGDQTQCSLDNQSAIVAQTRGAIPGQATVRPFPYFHVYGAVWNSATCKKCYLVTHTIYTKSKHDNALKRREHTKINLERVPEPWLPVKTNPQALGAIFWSRRGGCLSLPRL